MIKAYLGSLNDGDIHLKKYEGSNNSLFEPSIGVKVGQSVLWTTAD
jgi:hypothetical protein